MPSMSAYESSVRVLVGMQDELRVKDGDKWEEFDEIVALIVGNPKYLTVVMAIAQTLVANVSEVQTHFIAGLVIGVGEFKE